MGCEGVEGCSGHFLVALHWEVGISRRVGGCGAGEWGAACLLCVAEDMSQSYKLTAD